MEHPQIVLLPPMSLQL